MEKDTIHLESNFERYISKKLSELSLNDGWRVSNNDNGFDPNTALYMPDFVEYLTTTMPDKIKKMQDSYGANWESNLRMALVKSLENNGTVMTLREGFQMAGYQTIDCSGHYPDDIRIAKTKTLYDKNILRVMHQVHYQTAGNKSLDLVFFINGIPVATAEVKTELTQTVQDAIEEYQKERKPIEPDGRRKNYLLMYKRGAIVHFAISEDEIWMCTNLEGEKPKFLPFNEGNDGHAGNPPKAFDSDEYSTGYFWNKICRKDNWLRIFHNFIFEKVEMKEDVTGKLRPIHTQLFPRYHQWDCVIKAIADVKANGVGERYLIEHSAGSGKTETISWISHELIRLMDNNGQKLFSSIIVVTDRVGLDTNIKKTIKQLKKTVGLIEMIGGDGDKKTSGAKSKQLAKALHEKREIIVVTLQTFPFAMEAIGDDTALAGANFAVLIDEAHSSQEGTYSGKMKTALKMAAIKDKKVNISGADKTDITDEDAINAYFEMQQSSHLIPENVSFFAFTATPKAETKTIFGRPGDKVDNKTGQPLPESFHLYPMRQAIEENYIIDVLTGFMPYQTAYRLKDDIVTDKLVDERSALRTIAKWEKLHPTNVMNKAEFIIEHFVKNVAAMLNGQAKAMIVTSSRASVVRYKYAIDAYLKANPEYDRSKIAEHLQFKVPGEPLVAFSDKISGSKCIMTEDTYLEENPFAIIKTDYDYTEENINGLGYQTIENAFDLPKNRLLIVANKFQTGFNQPKLCAMYIDKHISNDIEIVQTYSRLNRTFSGKDKVYVIDFVNNPETVVRAFKKFDMGAVMEHTQSLDIIYEIKKKLDEADIYTADEFEVYKRARYQSISALEDTKDVYRQRLYKSVSVPAERWISSFKAQQTAYTTWRNVYDDAIAKGETVIAKQAEAKLKQITDDKDTLEDFRKKLKRYCSAYTYISQIVDFGDPDLEVFYGFYKLLTHKIAGTSLEEIDVKNLVLSDFRINKLDVHTGEEDGAVLKPMKVGGKARSSKQESLKVIISKINEIWGNSTTAVTGARTLNAIADFVAADDITRIQIRNSTNSKEAVIADGRLENIIKLAAVSLKNNDFEMLADKIINDPQTWKPLAEVIFDLVDNKKRVDIPELMEYMKNK